MAILIAGPTASGKSALALALVRRLGGCIINTDSMQVYRDLAILTARPSREEMASAPHTLYGTVDGTSTFSVSRWLDAASDELNRVRAEGLLPIFVGGTGLYFKALTQGLSDIPPVPAEIRNRLRRWAEGRAPEDLHAELTRRDPDTAARLRPTDPQRLLRAIEVHEATGEGLASFQGRRAPPVLAPGTWRGIALAVDRKELRARIDRRLDAMVAEGAMDEVERLAARNLDPALPVMRAIGVPSLLRHLNGAATLAEALVDAKAASRQYVKRQETFARHQLVDFRSVTSDEAAAVLLSEEAPQ